MVNEAIKPTGEHCKWTLNQFLYFNLDILQNIKAIKIVSSWASRFIVKYRPDLIGILNWIGICSRFRLRVSVIWRIFSGTWANNKSQTRKIKLKMFVLKWICDCRKWVWLLCTEGGRGQYPVSFYIFGYFSPSYLMSPWGDITQVTIKK